MTSNLNKRYNHLQLGLTLIECVMVLGIATAVSSAAIPMVKQYSANAAKDSALSDIQSSVLTARSAAINRSKNITVCATQNGSECSTEASDWNRGWIVFEDNGTHSVTTAEQIITKQLRASSGNTLTSTVDTPFFTFGMVGSLVSSPTRVVLRVHSNNNKLDSKCLLIAPPGRTSVITTANDPDSCPAIS